MRSVRNMCSLAILGTAMLTSSAFAASGDQYAIQPPAQPTTMQVAQATPGSPAMGMHAGTPTQAQAQAHVEQMNAMQAIHEKMLAAKTPAERNALMATQMTLMQNGMHMMQGMGDMRGMRGMDHNGSGSIMHLPGDLVARQGMMEQRMDMMQSMMQMMMDRMPPVPAAK